MTATNFVSPALLGLSLAVMFWLVPEKEIKRLLNLGLIGGLGTALVLLYIMQNRLRLWNFRGLDLVHVAEIPLLLSAIWIPVVIIFVYFLSRLESVVSTAAVIVSFPLGATLAHYLFISYDLLVYDNWSLFYTFLVSLAIHLSIAGYYYLTARTTARV